MSGCSFTGHNCAGKLSHSILQFSLLSNGDIVTLSPFIAGDLGEIMEVKSAQKTSKHYSCLTVFVPFTQFLSFFFPSFLFFFKRTTSFNYNKTSKSSPLCPLLTKRFNC